MNLSIHNVVNIEVDSNEKLTNDGGGALGFYRQITITNAKGTSLSISLFSDDKENLSVKSVI